MIHRIVVEDQSLRWYGRPPKVADDSIEFVQLQFHLPEEWASLLLVAQFTQADTYNMLMDGDKCFLPKELTAGLWKLSLFGYAEGKPLRATSIPLVFQIEESGFVSSAETPIPPTPDLYAQLIEYFSSIVGSGGGSGSGTINPEDIAAAVEDYLSKNPPEVPDLSDEVTRAETAASEAETASRNASASANNAGGYASSARDAASSAVSAANIADKAASDAEAAADRAEEAAKVTTDLDTTLTQEGKAADAKAVGDAISKLSGGNVDLTGYAKEQWVQQNYQPKGNYLTEETDPTVPVWAKQSKKPTYTAAEVGADPEGTATAAVSQHNTAEDSHNDMRLELKAINERLTAFFDSDDQTLDELSEIVAYITSNKSLIDSITTSKVSVADIINNLTTNVSNNPLSAAQGVVLKGLIDTISKSLSNYALKSEIPTKVSQMQNDSGYLTEHQDISGLLPRTELPTAINTALAQAKQSGEFNGADGQRGTGLLPITTAPSSYTTAVNGLTPAYRIALSTVKTQSKATAVYAGDTLRYSYYHYPVIYVDSSYVYCGDRVSIRGAPGAAGTTPVKGTDYYTDADKAEMVSAVIAALPDTAGVGY